MSYEYNLGIRFHAIASAHARRTALWFSENQSVTYEELNAQSNRIGRWLLDRGIRKGDLVCLSESKAGLVFAALIACLKIGAIYCFLDPDSPVERLRKILVTCKPKLLLAEVDLLRKLERIAAEMTIPATDKDDVSFLDGIRKCDGSNLPDVHTVTGEDAAYVMYTSGSTGFPKGAVITHANVLNLTEWSQETYRISQGDILTNVNPLYFDNSVFDIYSSLLTGACLVPFSKEEVTDPGLLVAKVDAARCTLWFSVPSLLIFLQTMKAMDGKHLRSIRRFIFGGEKYPKVKLKKLYDIYSDSSQLFNVYGPTECTCICSSYKITGDDLRDLHGLPPLGRIAGNFSFLILDDHGKRVSDGEVGELFLLGSNVGKGYYNDPLRTAESFVQNPYNTNFREVMYKTGDLVRMNPGDGKLYIHGRKDNQIKHMGYRIELEEVEAAMHLLDYVAEAVALHSDINGMSRIVAVVASGKKFEDDEIRRDLRRIIPDYMIPSVFHRADLLPKNPNGKVDRLQLAETYLRRES